MKTISNVVTGLISLLVPVALVALLSVSTAQARSFCTNAHDHDLDLPCQVEETMWYFGGSLGRAKLHAENTLTSSTAISSNSVVLGRRISDRLAIEGGYVQFGSFFNIWKSQALNVHVYSLSLLGRQPLDPGHYVSLYGRIGYASSVVTIHNVGKNWHGDATFGGGAEFTLDPNHNWYLRLGVDRYNTGALTVITPGVYEPRDWINNYSANVMFNF
jgi:opacity protein-like surface antigen